MIRRAFVTLCGVALVAAVPRLVDAHHAGVMFEEKKEITLQGVVKEFRYTNPHSWLLVDVANPDGSVTTWGFEAEGPSTLLRRGIRKSDFTAGTKVDHHRTSHEGRTACRPVDQGGARRWQGVQPAVHQLAGIHQEDRPMTALRRAAVIAIVTIASSSLLASVLFAQQPQPPTQSLQEWQRKYELGLEHKTAWDLYLALKAAAKAGQPPPPASQVPDWSGIWTTAGGGTATAPGPGGVMPKLTPDAAAALQAARERAARGVSYDENLSECGPAGHPRWLREPFLRDFIVTPAQTWLINEMVNEIRRIYTDGRDHLSEADRYPLPEGDSIGFWDGQKLVIHTNQLMARSMDRNAPRQSERMETVEVWGKVDATTILADVWLYDPAVYLEPWYYQRRYRQVPNPDRTLRIRYWDCNENPNNAVIKTKEGSTDFKDLTFTDKDNR